MKKSSNPVYRGAGRLLLAAAGAGLFYATQAGERAVQANNEIK